MKRVYKSAVLAMLMSAFVLTAASALADSQIRIVRLSSLNGNVQVERAAGQGSEKAILNLPITQDMVLSTGADGRAEVEFEDGTVIHLTPNTRIGFSQLVLRSSGAKASTIDVLQGTAYFNVRRKGDDEFAIGFAGRQLPLKKSSRFRVIAQPDGVKLAVFKGELALENRGEQVKVQKGEELTFNPGDGGTYLASGISSGEYDAWAQERTEYHDRYFSASAYKSYPYYGRGDLGFYGGWYDVPGYGPIWRPNHTASNWDPFSNGYWAWYPSSGYMWVSNYAWGWLPYRYGSWAFVPGWGWGWAPYGSWKQWNPSPRIVNPPSGYRPPVPPPTTATGPSHPRVPIVNPPHVPRRRLEDPELRGVLPKTPPALHTDSEGLVRHRENRGVAQPTTPPQRPAGVTLPSARPPRMDRGVVERPRREFEPMDVRRGPEFRGGRHSDMGAQPARQASEAQPSRMPSGTSSPGPSPSVSRPSMPRSESMERAKPAPRQGRSME